MTLRFSRPLVVFFALLSPAFVPIRAQPASLAIEAARTAVIVETTTPIEVFARFSVTVSGVRLVSGSFDSPDSFSNPLELNTGTGQLAASFSYTPTQSQPQPSLALDSAWPAGAYAFHVDWKNFSGAAVHGDYAANLAGGWPALPVLQAPQPLLPISSESADFSWLAWDEAPASGGSISFTLYEGLLTLEVIEQILAGDYSSLSSFTVVNAAPALDPATITRAVTGIDLEKDHILVLEFLSRISGATAPVATETRSSRMVTCFYRRDLANYAEWRAENFSETAAGDDSVSGPEADPDQDGVINLHEYAFVMQPLAADTAGLPTPRLVDGAFVFEHRFATSATDLSLSYEELGDDLVWRSLSSDAYAVATIAAAPSQQTLRVTPVNNGGARRILRTRIGLLSP